MIAAKPITHSALCRYLKTRNIPFEIADKYCKEVHYELYGKKYFAIGFKNNAGGFELRNANFKGSSSPKDISLLEFSGAKDVAVFEGFFSFLSYQTIHQKDLPLTNFLVLNSLSFFERNRSVMEEHQVINLYLDRDEAGKKNTLRASEWDKKYVDQSTKYQIHKDLNDFLIGQKHELKESHNLRMRF